jgi:hypothetical protein
MATGTQHKLVTTTVPRCMACSLLRLVLGIGTLLGLLPCSMRALHLSSVLARRLCPARHHQPQSIAHAARLLPCTIDHRTLD